jgi:uncharacterized protein (DUF736 family)
MPKIGTMNEVASGVDGEIFYNGNCDIPEIKSFQARANDRADRGEHAPDYVITIKDREVGAMWKKEDRNGKLYFDLKLNGYPLKSTIYMRGFKRDDGGFDLDYSAPDASKAKEAAA